MGGDGGNKEREGQGGVYDMEGEKMEGKGTTGAERRLSYPAAAKDQGHVHQASTVEMSGTQTQKSFVGVARVLILCPARILRHTHTHTQSAAGSQLPAVRLLREVMSDISSHRVSSFSPTIPHS